MDLWIFAYGSLMTKPTFDYVERIPATLLGHSRNFCILSNVWRGTPEKPGLVVGLVPGNQCQGFAFRIAPANHAAALAATDQVELIRDVYHRKTVPLSLADGRRVEGQAYVANLDSAEFRDYSPEEKIAMISTAAGRNGTSAQYLSDLRARLQELSILDEEVETLYRLIFKE
ncbi:MAG TPA: gamma-glutamylcyclotransferase [Bdellovibrionota bacterium]|jgi:cation transport protein ChaC|nr:gamma-glutamylcyclotransferase [Bdellovibrionota bacterium]